MKKFDIFIETIEYIDMYNTQTGEKIGRWEGPFEGIDVKDMEISVNDIDILRSDFIGKNV